jgi:hypothetical protein
MLIAAAPIETRPMAGDARFRRRHRADVRELLGRTQMDRATVDLSLPPRRRRADGDEIAELLTRNRAGWLRLSISDVCVADELQHASATSSELLCHRPEEHVLSGGRDGDQIGAERRSQLERERALEDHVRPSGVSRTGRNVRAITKFASR